MSMRMMHNASSATPLELRAYGADSKFGGRVDELFILAKR